MHKIVLIVFLSFSISFGKEILGKFDYYEFSLTWLPGFCKGTSPLPRECKIICEKYFTANNFSLHGLWPNVIGDTKHLY